MDYDVLILGGGIIGCSVAYELSKYSLNIALIEREYDIANDVSIINTSIVYDGLECENNLMSKLENIGNSLIAEVAPKLSVPFNRCGSFLIAKDEKQEKEIQNIYDRAIKRGIQDLAMLDGKHLYEMEPNLNIPIKKVLYSHNTGVICPYDMAIAFGEVAFDNGVNFKLEEEVLNIEKISRGFRVTTNKNKFTCKTVINTTPGNNFSIDAQTEAVSDNIDSTLNYMLLNRNFSSKLSNIVFTINDNNEVVSSTPTNDKETLISVNTAREVDLSDVRKSACTLVNKVEGKDIKYYYKVPYMTGPILIDDSLIDKGYVKVAGKHYAEITMTPAIAKIVCETIINSLHSKLKKDFIDKRREIFRFRQLSNEERSSLIKVDKAYGHMICVCNELTEGEIIDAIRRPLGARTVEGIKRRTGATTGGCHGAYCLNKIVKILARETNKDISEIVKSTKNSKIVSCRIKEFNEM